MGSPGADELALGQSCQSSSSLHLSPPWPWPPLSLMRPRHPAPTPRLQLTPGTAITAMEDTGEDTEATMAGLMATATTARDLLMRPPSLAPTPRLQLTPGTAITAMEDTEATMVDMLGLMATTATTARDLPMSLPICLPSLDPTPRPTLTRGIPTMDIMAMELTDLMVMATTPTGPMVTGDKQWRPSRTTSDLSLPTHL